MKLPHEKKTAKRRPSSAHHGNLPHGPSRRSPCRKTGNTEGLLTYQKKPLSRNPARLRKKDIFSIDEANRFQTEASGPFRMAFRPNLTAWPPSSPTGRFSLQTFSHCDNKRRKPASAKPSILNSYCTAPLFSKALDQEFGILHNLLPLAEA